MKKRSRLRGRRGLSSVVGTIMVFAIALTVVYGFFYSVQQDQAIFLKAAIQDNLLKAAQGSENIAITGTLVGAAIGFTANNSGIPTILVSYFLIDLSTGSVVQYNAGNISNPDLPYDLNQGQRQLFNTGAIYAAGHTYLIKVLTSRGNTFIGTYPPKQPSLKSVGSLIAAGLGSISMVFTSYKFYTYTSTGGPWVIDLLHPHNGALLPYGPYIALSLQIINNDPSIGTITINSHTDLWTYQTCQSGCGSMPLLTFYAVNVASNGTITSTSKSSFVPIQIPYGANATIYFASAYDLSLSAFAGQQIQGNAGRVGYGEYDIFLIVAGTKTEPNNGTFYSQNLPFAASYVADNIAWQTLNTTSCSSTKTSGISLTITNSVTSGASINKVVLNASGFSNIVTQAPGGWNVAINSGVITWSTGSNSFGAGKSLSFNWGGISKTSLGGESIAPFTVYFAGGTITVEQTAMGCYVSS